jgi:hypothetical protein
VIHHIILGKQADKFLNQRQTNITVEHEYGNKTQFLKCILMLKYISDG